MRAAGLVVGETLELLRRRGPAGDHHRRARRARRGQHPRRAARRRRSRATASRLPGHDLRLGQRRGRARDPRRPGARTTGDVVSIDCGAIVDGWHGDAAMTVAVGEVAPRGDELMRVTEEAMWRGIAAAALGGRVGDISHAVESYVREPGRLRHRRGLHRPRHRLRDAPAAQRAQRRAARAGPPARRGPGARRRADGGRWGSRGPDVARRRLDRRDRGRLAGRRTSSTPSRSPSAAPGCSPPSTAARPGWPSSASRSAGARWRGRDDPVVLLASPLLGPASGRRSPTSCASAATP